MRSIQMAQQSNAPVRQLSGTGVDFNLNPGVNAGRGTTLAQRIAENEASGSFFWTPGARAAPARAAPARAALPATPASGEPPQGGRAGKKARKSRKVRKSRKTRKGSTRRR